MLKKVVTLDLAGGAGQQVVFNPKAVAYFGGPVSPQMGKTIAVLMGQSEMLGIELEPEEVAQFYKPGDLREVQRDDPREGWGGQKLWVVADNIRSAKEAHGYVGIKFMDGQELRVKRLTYGGHHVLDELTYAGSE